MIWLFFYTDEAGTPKMTRRLDVKSWEESILVVNMYKRHGWNVTQIQCLKAPVL